MHIRRARTSAGALSIPSRPFSGCRQLAALAVVGLLSLSAIPDDAMAQNCVGGNFNPLSAHGGQSPSQDVIEESTVYVGNSRLRLTQWTGASATSSADAINDSHIAGDVGVRLAHAGSAYTYVDVLGSDYEFMDPANLAAYRPVSGLTFRLHDLDAGDRVEVHAYDEFQNPIALTAGMYSYDTTHGASIVSYYGSNTFGSDLGNVSDLRGTVRFNFAGYQVSRIRLRYYDVSGAGDYSLAGLVACNASLKVNKTTVGTGGGPFSFTLTNTGRNSGSTVTTSAENLPAQVDGVAATAGTQAFVITTPGSSVTVRESALPVGWSLSSVTCAGPGGATIGSWNAGTGTYTIPGTATGSGGELTCAFTNVRQPVLTLVKTVTNDNGGTQVATAWTLSAAGPTNISGITGNAAVTNAVVTAGNYTLSESATPTGYTVGTYSCVKNGGAAVVSNSLTLAAGDTATCTINNDDSNEADLSVQKSSSVPTATSGANVLFTLLVTNHGPAAAHGARVHDPAMSGLDCTAAGLPAPTCLSAGGAACPGSLTAVGLQTVPGVAIPTLPNGGSVSLGLTCRVTASGLP
jgi:uncharacterized repeat protein (TIGR01451 family)